jgi:hypothetical protein
MAWCTGGTNALANMEIMWKNNVYQGRTIDYTCISYLNKFTQGEDLLLYLLNRPRKTNINVLIFVFIYVPLYVSIEMIIRRFHINTSVIIELFSNMDEY